MTSFRKFSVSCPKCASTREVPYQQFWAMSKGITTAVCFICSRMKKGQTNKTSFKRGQVSPNKGNLGEKNPRWIKDRTKLKVSSSRSIDAQYRLWAMAVKKRDGYICRIADINCDGGLQAHHILPYAKFPELRYQLNNGITLCRVHHPIKKDDVAKLSPYFQSIVASSE